MAELADAPDLESGAERLAGSTPVTRTIISKDRLVIVCFFSPRSPDFCDRPVIKKDI